MPETREETDTTMPYPLRISTYREGRCVVHQAAGEIDSLTAPQLDEVLTNASEPAEHTILDLGEVPFLSSAGLSVLIEERQRCQARGAAFSVVASQNAVVRAIRITALDRVIPLYATVAEAIAAFDDQPGA